jgi:hypothetical protein
LSPPFNVIQSLAAFRQSSFQCVTYPQNYLKADTLDVRLDRYADSTRNLATELDLDTPA